MKSLAFTIVAVSFFVSSAAYAQPTVFINISCAAYVEETANMPNHAYNWFLAGYLSGTNLVRERLTPFDSASYRVWLVDYCHKRPFESFVNALSQLDTYLGSGKNTAVKQN